MYEYDSYRLEISLPARSLTAKVPHILLKIPFVYGRKRKRPLGMLSRREMPALKCARHINPVEDDHYILGVMEVFSLYSTLW